MTTLDFQSIHDQFRPRVLRYLRRLVGGSEAEDVTQAVMLKVYRGLPEFHANSSVSTWIYRIATNAALDKLRMPVPPTVPKPFDPEEGQVPPELRTDSVEQAAVRDEMGACIRDFLERLPQKYKTVMVLSEVEGFRNEEIASILGLSLATVKIRLHRGREQLRQDLERGCSFSRNECNELACDRKPVAAVSFAFRR